MTTKPQDHVKPLRIDAVRRAHGASADLIING